MTPLHFHGGPWYGQWREMPPVPEGEHIDVPDDYSGIYVQDETSAGGKCYDWVEEQ